MAETSTQYKSPISVYNSPASNVSPLSQVQLVACCTVTSDSPHSGLFHPSLPLSYL